MRVLSIVHQADAATGTFAAAVERAGAELVEWTFPESPPPAPAEAFDAVLVFGGTPHPDQDDRYPWLRAEADLLRGLVDRRVPVLGVCLGGQLLARALGGSVGPLARPEIGWHDVELTAEAASDPVLGALPRRFTAFQWHSYGFGLPPGAVALAHNATGLQAYRAGEAAWGVQFHPEVDEETVRRWIASGRRETPSGLAERTPVEIGRWIGLGGTLCSAFLEAARSR
jgi:GMP synthase (glutamine-hydrolysing)